VIGVTVGSSLKNELSVVHSVNRWLGRTETWLYTQIVFLPPEVKNSIVCDTTENIAEFWLPNIYSLRVASPWRYHLDARLRRLGITPHSGFLPQIARKQHANILHSHFGYRGWENYKTARKVGLKHVVTFYGYDVNQLPTVKPRWNDRYHTMFEHVDLVLCEGSHMGECVVRRGCPRHKVRVHHLGIDLSKISFVPRVWNSAEPIRVLIAAAFREKKGIPYALEALGRIQNEVPLEITVIGDATDNPRSQLEKQKILASIKKHDLQSKIRLLGFKPYDIFLEEAYKHHVFLSPSVTASDGDTEGGAPVSIIEMLASGMPVVSTEHCDIPEVVQNGVSGLLANERDVDGLVKCLKWLFDHPEKWSRMLEAGRNHIEKEYNARVQGQRLSSLYRGLVE
jgi:colanic acid/amylovoran biosynthesis glycosyltransferase